MTTAPEGYLTLAAAARIAGLTREAVRQRVDRATLPFVEHGGRRFVTAATAEALADEVRLTRRGRAKTREALDAQVAEKMAKRPARVKGLDKR